MSSLGLVTGRDVELVLVGVFCLSASAWLTLTEPVQNWRPGLLFAGVGVLSLGLAAWDVDSRDRSR